MSSANPNESHGSNQRPPSGPTPARAQQVRQRRHRAMLLSAMAGCHVSFVVAVVLVWLFAGRVAGANALVAAAVTMLFFASGLGSQVVAAELGGSLGLGVTLVSFLTRAALLAGLVVLARRGHVEPLLDAAGLLIGAGAACVGWIGGLIRAEVRGHWPVYDTAL